MKFSYYIQGIFIIIFLLLLSSCSEPTSAFYPPEPNQNNNKTIYVIKHKWHTGIILLKKDADSYIHSFNDFENSKYLEIGWGDETYYQAEEKTIWMAIKALFLPTNSIIHVVAFQKDPITYFSNSEIIELKLSRKGFVKLTQFINNSFVLNEKGEPIKSGKDFYGASRFYHANGTFHMFNNCNTWSAEAINSSGFPISKYTFSAPGVLYQLKQNKD